ncbi:DUF7344 domain-containing protein [Haloprofundus salinisoli]|uniref:DUF7344 domain-containing protein n=1 Tax=Haloprofundus salinisoli TaxID=2876193 RepID=UPI003CE56725
MNQGRNALLSALADYRCHSVIVYFRNASEDHASVDDIATVFARRDQADQTQIAIRLHHAVLPKLANVGLVDYDARTKMVRYRGHSQPEQVEESLSEFGSGMSWRCE